MGETGYSKPDPKYLADSVINDLGSLIRAVPEHMATITSIIVRLQDLGIKRSDNGDIHLDV